MSRGLTLEEMNRRIAARDAERDRSVVRRDIKPAKVRRKPPAPALLCALCTADIPRPFNAPPNWMPRQEPLGRDDALVLICEPCATEAVRERDHLFGSRGGGVGEGNRRISSRHAVKR